MSHVSKAIIPVAGWGSRRLPITKVIEKCMLPIGNRPLVDYVVEDCRRAGINEIIFIVSSGSTQLQDYYGAPSRNLVTYLETNKKHDLLPLVTPPSDIVFRFVEQPDGGKYGTAVPVGLASQFVAANESAVVLMGDDFLYNTDGSSDVARLIEQTGEGECGLLAVEVDPQAVSRYGVIEHDSDGRYQRIVEKPAVDEAPSNLINVSKYLLTKAVIDAAATIAVSPRGEYELPDVVNNFVGEGGTVRVVKANGIYLDGGSVEGWLHANQTVVGGR